MAPARDKPALHVIDEALEPSNRLLPFLRERRYDLRQVRAYLPRAKRFILTDQASTRLGEIVRDTEKLMLGALQFAIPPYPVTYLELNSRLFLDALGRETYQPADAGDQDERVGYLITGEARRFQARVFSRTAKGDASPGPFIIRRGMGPGIMPKNRLFRDAEDIRFNLGIVLLGTTYDAADRAAIDYVTSEWSLDMALEIENPSAQSQLFLETAGEARNVMAALLILNQPTALQMTAVKHSSGIRRGRRVIYAAHSTVEITLGTRKQYRRLWAGYPSDRLSPRRHQVRGHFRHYGVDPNCVHEWPKEPDSSPHGRPGWTCGRCSGRRVWLEAHERGDATRGYKTKDYSLT